MHAALKVSGSLACGSDVKIYYLGDLKHTTDRVDNDNSPVWNLFSGYTGLNRCSSAFAADSSQQLRLEVRHHDRTGGLPVAANGY